jgi:hypothetical protein
MTVAARELTEAADIFGIFRGRGDAILDRGMEASTEGIVDVLARF